MFYYFQCRDFTLLTLNFSLDVVGAIVNAIILKFCFPAIPLLGIYPKKTIIPRESCTTMLIAALFTIARTWKQPKCPSTEEWVKRMWHMYTMEYYSAIKRNKIELFVVREMASKGAGMANTSTRR